MLILVASNIHKIEKLGMTYTSPVAAELLTKLTQDILISIVSFRLQRKIKQDIVLG